LCDGRKILLNSGRVMEKIIGGFSELTIQKFSDFSERSL
jgi:hypothetical protein